MAGGGEVLVLAAVGRLGGVPRLAQLAVEGLQLGGACGDALFQFVVEGLQALLGEDALGDVGDEAFHQVVFLGLEQQVHQHVDMAAVLPTQAGFVAEQAFFQAQRLADVGQLRLAALEQLLGKVVEAQQCGGFGIAEHACQRRIGGAQAVAQAGLEDAVHRVLEQPLVAVALGFQLFQAGQQLGVMALARRMAAEAEQRLALLLRGLRHTPLRRRAGSTRAGW